MSERKDADDAIKEARKEKVLQVVSSKVVEA